MQGPLTEQVLQVFERMPARLRAAARWVLDHPEDVALLSLREQARRAGVQPATMTRLAKRLGFSGYGQIRQLHAQLVRQQARQFQARAAALVTRRAEEGEFALATDILGAQSEHLRTMSAPEPIEALMKAADRISRAARVICLGLRSSFPSAYVAHYIQGLIGAATTLIDGAGGTGVDVFRTVRPSDVVLAIGLEPYTRQTIEMARYARSHGATIVTITDSRASPLARLAKEVIVVPSETPSFFHTVSPAFIAAETLMALVAAKKGRAAIAALANSEEQLSAFDTYVFGERTRRRRR